MPLPLLPRRAAFVAVAVSLTLVFLASGSPIPLYNVFRVEDGLSNTDLAITTVVYLGATAASLLVLGRLSDRLGRRPMAVAAVLLALSGCAVLTQVHDPGTLMAGRLLQGVACGMASSSLGSYAVDLAPPRPPWLPALITSTVPPVAVPIGALGSGALATFGPAPRLAAFILLAVALLVCAALLLRCPETVPRSRGALAALVPRVAVPAAARRALPGVAAALLASWSVGGYYQAFGPGITADQLGTDSPLVIAVVFGSMVLLAPVGAAITGRLRPLPTMRFGALLFAVAIGVAMAALAAGAIVPFLVASFLGGAAQGASSAAGMRLLLPTAAPTERAGLLAAIFLISYASAAVPGFVAGQLAVLFDPVQLGSGVAGLSGLAAVLCLLLARPTAR